MTQLRAAAQLGSRPPSEPAVFVVRPTLRVRPGAFTKSELSIWRRPRKNDEKNGWNVGREVQYSNVCHGNILHQLLTGQSKCGAANVILVWEMISLSSERWACHQWRFAAEAISHLLLEHPRWFPLINAFTSTHSGPLIVFYSLLNYNTDRVAKEDHVCVFCQLFSCTCQFHAHPVARPHSPRQELLMTAERPMKSFRADALSGF